VCSPIHVLPASDFGEKKVSILERTSAGFSREESKSFKKATIVFNIQQEMRERITRNAVLLYERGLVTGSEGSISVKVDDQYMLCTPEGISFRDLKPSQVQLIDMSVPRHQLRDSEGATIVLHTAFYRHVDNCSCIIHTHPVHATILSCMSKERIKQILKPFTKIQARKFHEVTVIPFFLHQRSLIENHLKKWHFYGNTPIFIMGNDGVIITAEDISQASDLTEEFEKMASMSLNMNFPDLRTISEGETKILCEN